METLMLFLTILAWCGAGYFTTAWLLVWGVVLAGHGGKLKLKLGAVIGPVLCWGWLIAGWMS